MVKILSQQPALGGEDTGCSKRLTSNVMRELSAHMGVLRFQCFARPRMKDECSGETHDEKGVNGIASLYGMN